MKLQSFCLRAVQSLNRLLTLNVCRLLLTLLHLTFFFWISLFIFRHLNFLQIDLAGHIASSVQYSRFGSYTLNDRIFLGSIHGLFYPPLEDWIIHGIHSLFRIDHIESYKAYLILILALFHGSIIVTWLRFNSRLASMFFGLSTLYMIAIEKKSLIHLQGLGHMDLLITGLSNQFIAGSMLFFLISEIIRPSKRSVMIIIISTIISILSHIVVAIPVTILAIVIFYKRLSFRKFLNAIIFIIGSTTFYTLPFILNLNFLAKNHIYGTSEWWPWVLTLLGLVTGLKNSTSKILGISALILLTTVTLFNVSPIVGSLLPKFHYYRFAIIGIFISISALSMGIEDLHLEQSKGFKFKLFTVSVLGFVVYMALSIHPYFPRANQPKHQETSLSVPHPEILSTSHYGRYLVLGEFRPADFGLDSLLTLHNPEFRSSKGLFWESSYSNSLQSSYLATLLGTPMVLDYLQYKNYNCNIQQCLIDQYIRQFNIKGVIDEPDRLTYLKQDQKECYQTIFKQGTSQYLLKKKGEVILNERGVNVYELHPKKGTEHSIFKLNEAVEKVAQINIRTFEMNKLKPHSEAMSTIFEECVRNDPHPETFFVTKDQFSNVQNHEFETDFIIGKSSGIPLVKESESKFSFDGSEKLAWHLVKLSPQPGLKAYFQNGETATIANGYGGFLVLSKGKTTIEFGLPTGVISGKFISVLTFLMALIFFLRNLKKHKSSN